MPRVPRYDEYVPASELVKIMCRGPCSGAALGRLIMDEEANATENEKFAGCIAACLKCGYRARDNENWCRP
jgi:hypothetical protein